MQKFLTRARRSVAILANEFDYEAKVTSVLRRAAIQRATFLQERNVCLIELDNVAEARELLASNQTVIWKMWRRRYEDLPPMRLTTVKPSPRRNKRQHCQVFRDEWKSRPDYIIDRLQQAHNLSAQMAILMDVSKPNDHDFLLRAIYTTSLGELMDAARRGSILEPFGSSRSGLMTRGSDVDLRLTPGDRTCESPVKLPSQVRPFSTYRSPHVGKINRFIRYIDPLDPKTFFHRGRIHRVCVRHPDLNLQYDIITSKVQCDGLVFADFLAKVVENEVCPELNLLLTSVKWFTASHDLYQATNCLMSGFKVQVLLIHFLQSRGLMPAFKDLMDGMERKENRPVEDVGTLLCDFFAYFAAYEGMDVQLNICLLSGTITKEKSHEGEKVIVIIKEPFNPELNIMDNVYSRTWNHFVDFCAVVHSKLRENQSPDRDRNWGILCALSDSQMNQILAGQMPIF